MKPEVANELCHVFEEAVNPSGDPSPGARFLPEHFHEKQPPVCWHEGVV